MPKLLPIACLLTSLLLASGCASQFPPAAASQCPEQEKPPTPAAWMMEPSPPTFSQRLRQLLPVSPETPTPVQ